MPSSDHQNLSQAELQTWRRFVVGTHSLFRALDKQLRDESGLSGEDFRFLSHLSTAPHQSMRMSQLAEELSFSPSRLSHTVKRMEEKGWVTRDATIEDGRGRTADLTQEGRRILGNAWPGHALLIKQLVFDQFDDDQRHQFEDVYTNIARAAKRHHAQPDSD